MRWFFKISVELEIKPHQIILELGYVYWLFQFNSFGMKKPPFNFHLPYIYFYTQRNANFRRFIIIFNIEKILGDSSTRISELLTSLWSFLILKYSVLLGNLFVYIPGVQLRVWTGCIPKIVRPRDLEKMPIDKTARKMAGNYFQVHNLNARGRNCYKWRLISRSLGNFNVEDFNW